MHYHSSDNTVDSISAVDQWTTCLNAQVTFDIMGACSSILHVPCGIEKAHTVLFLVVGDIARG